MGGTNWWDIPEEKRDDGKTISLNWKKLQRANFVKRAVKHADVINTVSERYAQEILTPEFGQGLDKLLLKRKDDVYGIINGIDYSVSNPLLTKTLRSITIGIHCIKRRKINWFCKN